MTLKIKRLISVLLLALVLLFSLFAMGSSTMSVGLLRDGTGDVSLSVRKEKVAAQATDLDAFKTYFEGYLAAITSASESTTPVATAKNYSETDTHYRVTVNTRRVDKLQGFGKIYYDNTVAFRGSTGKYSELERAYRGYVSTNMEKVYADGTKKTFSMSIRDNPIKIEAKGLNDEQPMDLDTFENVLYESEKNKILYFNLVDFQFADEIQIKLTGNVKYVSVTTNTQTNETVDMVEADGATVTLKTAALSCGGETVQCCLGYVIYADGVSGWAIAGIVIGIAAIAAFIWFGIVKGGVARFFKGGVWKRMVRFKALYLLLLPAFVLLILFRYMPMVWLSAGFMEYDLLQGLGSEWVGLKYFESILYATNTPEMYQIFRNTIFISLIRIASNLPVILLLAMLINSIRNKPLRTVFQTLSFIPYFLSWVAVGGIFNALLDPNTGLINKLFASATNWYGDPDPWWTILSVSSLWKGMGWSTLIYISAMCNIDNELYEACALDGGGAFRQMITVTLPGIMNIICLQLILDVSNILRDNYEQILAMTNGQMTGAIQETVDVVGRIAFTSLRDMNYGSATAIGLIQGVIGSLLVFVTNKVVKKTENEGII